MKLLYDMCSCTELLVAQLMVKLRVVCMVNDRPRFCEIHSASYGIKQSMRISDKGDFCRRDWFIMAIS